MTDKRQGRPRAYVHYREYGRVDVDITREELAHQVVSAAHWWQSEIVLFVAPDGMARAYMADLAETDREMVRRTADVVGTHRGHDNLEWRREQIKARILTDLRHHLPEIGAKVAA